MFLQNRQSVRVSPKSAAENSKSGKIRQIMEAAGIEPASENVPQESLHTCQIPILSRALCLKESASQQEHQPVEFGPARPGQSCGTILQKVTPFDRPTGESAKDVSWC